MQSPCPNAQHVDMVLWILETITTIIIIIIIKANLMDPVQTQPTGYGK